MRNSQFIRGAGVGLLAATLIFTVTFGSGRKTTPMTDREIIRKARELGMYTEEDVNNMKLDESLSKVDGNLNQNDQPGDDGTGSGSDTATGGAVTSPDKTITPSAISAGAGDGKQEKPVSDGGGKQEEPTSDGDDKPEKEPVSKGDVKITVSEGMLSHEVARLLEQAGVVKSAAEFDRYLMDHGYETNIRSGVYTFSSDADYETIAKVLMKK